MSSSGIAVGLERGFPVTKRVVGARPSNAKAVRNNFSYNASTNEFKVIINYYLIENFQAY